MICMEGMNIVEVVPGDIVLSAAGRDKDNFFVVMTVSENYAYLCDGRKRKTDRQKLKKLKHLKTGIGHSEYIARKIAAGEKVTNAELRRELSEYFMEEDV